MRSGRLLQSREQDGERVAALLEARFLEAAELIEAGNAKRRDRGISR